MTKNSIDTRMKTRSSTTHLASSKQSPIAYRLSARPPSDVSLPVRDSSKVHEEFVTALRTQPRHQEQQQEDDRQTPASNCPRPDWSVNVRTIRFGPRHAGRRLSRQDCAEPFQVRQSGINGSHLVSD